MKSYLPASYLIYVTFLLIEWTLTPIQEQWACFALSRLVFAGCYAALIYDFTPHTFEISGGGVRALDISGNHGDGTERRRYWVTVDMFCPASFRLLRRVPRPHDDGDDAGGGVIGARSLFGRMFGFARRRRGGATAEGVTVEGNADATAGVQVIR